MKIISNPAELTQTVEAFRAANPGKTVGLVPTMGALHKGHLSLINRARKENDLVVVSVFVNPRQFNNPADLKTYPRTPEKDAALLQEAGVDIAFMPAPEDVYAPDELVKTYDLGPVAEVMEGKMRPGHFQGVAVIVSKLLSYAKPDKAYFGEKDFQQIAVIRRMAQIDGHEARIVACPILREADGLALSSRNVRLDPAQRSIAPKIHEILERSVGLQAARTPRDVEGLVTRLINAVPGMRVEYYQIVNPYTMQPAQSWAERPVGCVTVYLGDVRLIDNIKY